MKLTMKTKQDFLSNGVMAVYGICNVWGYNYYGHIDDGAETYAVCAIAMVDEPIRYEDMKAHKVYYTSKGAYINLKGARIYLNEFMRV